MPGEVCGAREKEPLVRLRTVRECSPSAREAAAGCPSCGGQLTGVGARKAFLGVRRGGAAAPSALPVYGASQARLGVVPGKRGSRGTPSCCGLQARGASAFLSRVLGVRGSSAAGHGRLCTNAAALTSAAMWHNPSIERTHNGEAQWCASAALVAPLCAAHVER